MIIRPEWNVFHLPLPGVRVQSPRGQLDALGQYAGGSPSDSPGCTQRMAAHRNQTQPRYIQLACEP
jgi:hypothetical protein